MSFPGFAMGQGSSLNANSSADMGADYSQNHFGGITFNKSPTPAQTTNDTVKWVALVVGAVLIAKVMKG